MKNEERCTCGVPNEIHHNTACGWEYACIPFLPFEKLSYPMTIEDKKERWMKWTAFWHSVNTPVSSSVCEHDYMQRGGAVKYYRCVKCGNEKI